MLICEHKITANAILHYRVVPLLCHLSLLFVLNIPVPLTRHRRTSNELLQLGTERSLIKRQPVFKAGDLETTIHILRRGRVKIVQSSPLGREVLLWFCLPGEVFGVSESLQEKARSVTAVTVESSYIVTIERSRFSAWLNDHPAHSLNLLGIMATRLRELSQRFLSLASGNVEVQVAKLLIDLSACYGTRVDRSILVNIPLTHQDIADMIGASRQCVSATMSNLKRSGVLSTKRRFLCIAKFNKLVALAGLSASAAAMAIGAVSGLLMSMLAGEAFGVCMEACAIVM